MSATSTGRCLIDRGAEITVNRKEPIKSSDSKFAITTGYRTVPDGTMRALVEVWVDAEALYSKLAAKAIRSKTGRAQVLNGAVVVVARNRRKGGATAGKT